MTISQSVSPAGVKSAERTLDVLELLASTEQPLTLSEISRKLEMPKSSLHKLLGTMERRRWVETDEVSHTRYRIGLHALLIGTRYVDIDEVVQLAQPLLTAITETLQEASHLGRLDGGDIVYLAKRESPHPLRMFSAVGRRLPAHATAMGKAILAGLPWEEVDSLLPHRLARLTSKTIATRPALKDELDRVRAEGFAVDDEESAELMRAVAIALPDFSSRNAISVSAPTARLPLVEVRHHADTLRELATQQFAVGRSRSK
jgi:DNA-binding IclR family transcriptional regulator